MSIAAGVIVLVAAMAVTAVLRRGSKARQSEEVAELRKSLLTAEAIIKAEPQVLVFWEQGQGVRVMVHTLSGIAGLPGAASRASEVRRMARCRIGPGAQEGS